MKVFFSGLCYVQGYIILLGVLKKQHEASPIVTYMCVVFINFEGSS